MSKAMQFFIEDESAQWCLTFSQQEDSDDIDFSLEAFRIGIISREAYPDDVLFSLTDSVDLWGKKLNVNLLPSLLDYFGNQCLQIQRFEDMISGH